MRHAQLLVGAQVLTAEQAKASWQEAGQLLGRAFDLAFPWLAGGVDRKATASAVDALWGRWKKRFGDPKDPRVLARIQATASRVLAEARAGRRQGG